MARLDVQRTSTGSKLQTEVVGREYNPERRRGSRREWRDRSDSGESDLMPDLELLLSPTFGIHPSNPDKSELWVTG